MGKSQPPALTGPGVFYCKKELFVEKKNNKKLVFVNPYAFLWSTETHKTHYNENL